MNPSDLAIQSRFKTHKFLIQLINIIHKFVVSNY
jgi:hypothetical protein